MNRFCINTSFQRDKLVDFFWMDHCSEGLPKINNFHVTKGISFMMITLMQLISFN